MAAETQKPRVRLGELDALRGIAAAVVVLFHYTTRLDQLVPGLPAPSFRVPWGHHGVDLFFVISGFVIFMTLERAKSATDFGVSRVTRLYPGYWVGILATLGVAHLVQPPVEGWHVGITTFVINLTMLQAFVPGIPHVDGAYWTLSIELIFYFWIAALFVMGGVHRIRLAIVVMLVVSVGVYGAEWLRGGTFGGTANRVLMTNFGPLFACGILFYKIRSKDRIALDSLMIVSCLAIHTLRWGMEGLAAASITCALFVAFQFGWLRPLANPILLYLGAISYSLYVVHQNIGYSIIQKLISFGVGRDLSMLAAAVFCIGLASAITYGVEMPAQRALRKQYARWKSTREAAVS